MDKILHRVENMQSKESKRRTQSSASGRPKRDPSANKSRAANSPARSTRTNGPEAPVASEMLRSDKVPQAEGYVTDWAQIDTEVSIFPGDGKKCIFVYYLHKEDDTGKIIREDLDATDLLKVESISSFIACFRNMKKCTKQMETLSNLLKYHTGDAAVISRVSIKKLDEMEIDEYLAYLGVSISSIGAKNGVLEVELQNGVHVYSMHMSLEWFRRHFANITIEDYFVSELTHEDYFESWVASDMVMKYDLHLTDKPAMNKMQLVGYLTLLCVPVIIDTDSDKPALYMHVEPENGGIAVRTRIVYIDAYSLQSLFVFALSHSNERLINFWHLLRVHVSTSKIGPLMMHELYDTNAIVFLQRFDITVSFTSEKIGAHTLYLDVYDEKNDQRHFKRLVTLNHARFPHIFKTIHSDLFSKNQSKEAVDTAMKALVSAAKDYLVDNKALFIGYTLTQLGNMELQDYFKHTELDEVTSQSILAELEPETTRTDVTESGGLALNKTLMSQDDVVSLLSKTRDLSVSFRYYSDATIHTGLHRRGQIICYHDIDANDFVKFFPNWIEKESVDINRIRDCLGVGKYYGPWSVEVLKKIDSFEKITEQKMKTDKLAADDVHDKLIGILKRMNANSSVVDEHNAPAPDLPALDTGNLALVSVQDDSSLMHTDGTAHWMHDCPINRLYQQSPDQAIEAYRRLLDYVFCAYLQRETTEDNYQLGNKFNIIKRNLEIHEHAQQQHRSSHEPFHPYLSYTDFIEAIGHHAYTINGTREKCHIPGEYFKTSWHLPTMNDLMQFTNIGYKFGKRNDGQYELTEV